MDCKNTWFKIRLGNCSCTKPTKIQIAGNALFHWSSFLQKVEGQRGDDYLKKASPEEIRLLDPASGSGHILVYGFDLLTKIYEEEGYQTSENSKLIVRKTYGFEIDERAAQLSGFALMMKAVESQRRSLQKEIIPKFCFKDLLADDK